jgi:hypothetical protein
VIEPARRHGHSDPRYPASYFARFSATARATRAARPDAIASSALTEWEGEGGAGAADEIRRARSVATSIVLGAD